MREFEWQRLPTYEERFKYELEELTIRLNRLEEQVTKNIEKNDCSVNLLIKQLAIMKDYQAVLLRRAAVEGISIWT